MLTDKKIHFISMDIPFPPNYGGVIDVFFKLRAMHQVGIKIYLHLYGSSSCGIEELKPFTEEIYYYPIKKNPIYFLKSSPFSVKSRRGEELLKNIKRIKAPIFFESLKTTEVLNLDCLEDYPKYLRLHNIEQNYYKGLASSEKNKLKRLIYALEAIKYVRYEQIIDQMDEVFTLSKFEQDYIKEKFNKGKYIPVFHGNNDLPKLKEFGKYVMYHGDLRTADNCKVVEFLIDVFKKLDYSLVIASSIKEEWVKSKIKSSTNIKFIKLNDFSHLLQLFQEAHINVAWSFQESGTKLKVINALFNSRYSVINKNIIDDENIEKLCFKVENESELIVTITTLMDQPFLPSQAYQSVLKNYLNDGNNVVNLLNTIFV